MATPETTQAQARKEYLRAEARIYLTDQLAKGTTEIKQPAELWADIRAAFGPRATVFSAAGWGWWNQAMTEHRERQLAASLRRGLADSAAGRVTDLGDFTQYAGDEA